MRRDDEILDRALSGRKYDYFHIFRASAFFVNEIWPRLRQIGRDDPRIDQYSVAVFYLIFASECFITNKKW